MLFSPAGRDNTDDFFAIPVLPVCVNNEQHDGGRGLNRHGAESMPARFSRLVDAVQADQTVIVFEYQSRQLE
jgi:hypothetical protein